MIEKNALILLAAAILLSGCTPPATTGRASSDGTIRLTEERIGHPLTATEPAISVTAEAERERRLNDYWTSANSGLVGKPLSTPHARDVSETLKKTVIHRDGGKCRVCDSTTDLEVDHRVALVNGGDNLEANLATLCRRCHHEKTAMDKSLRRNRQKITQGKGRHLAA